MIDDDLDVSLAAGLTQSIGRLSELRLPDRPRFVGDLLRVPIQNGVHLLGAEPQTIYGKSVAWLFEVLVPLLDGTRLLPDLRMAVPDVKDSDLMDVLHLLHMHGMLEEGTENTPLAWREYADRRFGSQLAFFSRYLRVTGKCVNRYEAQRAISLAQVALIGDLDVTLPLRRQLAAMGVGRTFCVRPSMAGSNQAHLSVPHLIDWSVIDLSICIGDQKVQENTLREHLARRKPILFVDPMTLTLGPLTYPRLSACPACIREQFTPRDKANLAHSSPLQTLWLHALLSRSAIQAIGLLSGLFETLDGGILESWSFDGQPTVEHRVMPRLPNCPLCGKKAGPLTITLAMGHRDNLALLYHRASEIQPWQLRRPASIQLHFSGSVRRLTSSAYLAYRCVRRIPLPRDFGTFSTPVGRAFSQSVTRPAGSLGLPSLADLLHYSAGGRSRPLGGGAYYIKRYIASGGNLGSAEPFLITLNVDGLENGLYHYLLTGHALEVLKTGDFARELANCFDRGFSGLDDEFLIDAKAVLTIVSAVTRHATKYLERGYIYCLLDAGLLAHRIALLASQLGFSTRIAWRFNDEALSTLLGVDGLSLAPAMLIALVGRRGVTRRPGRITTNCLGDRKEDRPQRNNALQSENVLSEDLPWPSSLTACLIASSGRTREELQEFDKPTGPFPADAQKAIPLSATLNMCRVRRTLRGVISARRSGGIVGDRPIGQRTFGTLLAGSASCLSRTFAADPATVPILCPVVFDVEGLSPAAYRYLPVKHALIRLRSVDRAVFRDDILLQLDHGSGVAVLLIVVPLRRWLEAYGDRGYRGVAFQVGWLCDRLYLIAESLGLTYTASGGFAPASADTFLGLDGYDYTTFFTFVVGSHKCFRQL